MLGVYQIDERVVFNVAGGLLLEHPLILPFVDTLVSYHYIASHLSSCYASMSFRVLHSNIHCIIVHPPEHKKAIFRSQSSLWKFVFRLCRLEPRIVWWDCRRLSRRSSYKRLFHIMPISLRCNFECDHILLRVKFSLLYLFEWNSQLDKQLTLINISLNQTFLYCLFHLFQD